MAPPDHGDAGEPAAVKLRDFASLVAALVAWVVVLEVVLLVAWAVWSVALR